MNNRDAQLILECFQPGYGDDGDPTFQEALALTEAEPQLGRWFARELESDELIRLKLQQSSVPADLKLGILEGNPATRVYYPTRQLFALAACLVILLSAILLVWKPFASRGPQFADYQLQMVQTLYRPLSFEFPNSNLAAVQSWLSTNSALGELSVPPALKGLSTLGCRTLSLNGRPAAVLCFLVSKDEAVHLFVMSADNLRGAPSLQPGFRTIGSFATAAWSDGKRVYVLAGHGDKEFLKRFLPELAAAPVLQVGS